MASTSGSQSPTAGPASWLGAGYDSVGGAIRASAVKGSTATSGGVIDKYVTVCHGIRETSDALKIDQSLSMKYLASAKVDEKIEFLKQQNLTEESLSIVAYARRQTGSSTLRNPQFDSGLKDMPTDNFVKAYGDSYIDSVTLGGEYCAVYTFHTQTVEKREELKASLKASGVVSGVEMDASLGLVLNSFSKSSNTTAVVKQHVTGLAKHKLPANDKIIEFAGDFTDLELDAPVIIGRTTSRYEQVVGFAVPFQQIATNRNYFVGVDGHGGLAGKLVQIMSLQNQVSWLRDIYDCFGYKGDPELDNFSRLLAKDLQEIKQQFEEYAVNPTKSFTPPPLTSLDKDVPMLTFETGVSPQWGGTGGGPWSFGDVEYTLPNRQRIKSIQLAGWDYVDKIVMEYTNSRGDLPAQTCGGSFDHPEQPLVMKRGEFPTKLRGRAGVVLDRLEITTNKGAVTSVSRDDRGNPFEWTVPAGSIVVGLRGRAGKHIDAIQAVYITLKPAEFRPAPLPSGPRQNS